jgi:hypothetical protein
MHKRLLPGVIGVFVFAFPASHLHAQEGIEGVATGLGNRFIQMNTPLTNDKGVFEAIITHRFNQAVKDAGSGGFWGLDGGAVIGLGVEYAPVKNVAVQIYRMSTFQDYEFAAKVTLLRPSKGLPVAVGVRGGLNWLTAPYFTKQSSGFGQVIVSATLFDRVTLAAAPAYVQRTPFQTDVWNVPVMGQLRITDSIALIGEFIPKKSSAAPDAVYQWSAMLEKRLYHHRFALYIGNTIASTMDQMIGGDFVGGVTDLNIHFGFNLSRDFDLFK